MIKKHLITCSVILVLFIVSQLFICSTTFKRKSIAVNINYHAVDIGVHSLIRYNKDANDEINFADELMPAHNAKVTRKLNYSLKQHSFSKIGSTLLHRKALELFPVIEPILKMYGIPDDFKYIPLVESGLCSGTSSRGARGLWQFMPVTARTYGLKVGNGKDERLNLRKSTIAACVYLRELYTEFDSWTLTAAAYNLGSIKLQKAINRNDHKRNYYAMHLNAETGSYVYKLLAMKEVINRPTTYGYKNTYTWLKSSQLLAAN
jgi:membrane-bound lytic murein transglycosylase D